MIGPLRNRTMAVAVVAALQLAALGYFVWDRERRVRNGTDVVLEVVPVDPRSLFQGDYVILGYPISVVEAWFGAEPTVGQDVYVSVVPGSDGNWKFADFAYSGESSGTPGGVTLKGRVDRVIMEAAKDGSKKGQFRVVYGLERFFVPEGMGRNLEDLVRKKKLSAIVSVWRDGSSTLKGLSSEGKVRYETGVTAKAPEDVPPLAEQGFAASAVEPAVQEAPVQAAPVEAAPATPAADAPVVGPPPPTAEPETPAAN